MDGYPLTTHFPTKAAFRIGCFISIRQLTPLFSQLYALLALNLHARKTVPLSFNHTFGMNVAFRITGTLGFL